MQFSGDERSFDRYALPQYGISLEASQANKLIVVAGQLLYKTTPVQTLNITECLKEFNDFLKGSKSRVVLAAHNGRVFHSRILAKALFKKNLLRAFQSVVIGFVDTLPLFKKLLPGRQSCKQESLVNDCLNKSCDFHNSLEDVKSLRELLLYHNPSCSSLSVHSFTVGFQSIS